LVLVSTCSDQFEVWALQKACSGYAS